MGILKVILIIKYGKNFRSVDAINEVCDSFFLQKSHNGLRVKLISVSFCVTFPRVASR